MGVDEFMVDCRLDNGGRGLEAVDRIVVQRKALGTTNYVDYIGWTQNGRLDPIGNICIIMPCYLC